MRPRQVVPLPAPSASDIVPVDSVPSAGPSPGVSASSTTNSNNTTSVSVSLSTSETPASSASSTSLTSESISLTFGVPLPTVSPGSELGSPPFHVVYLIPVIIVFSVILLIFIIWSIQGCCTRRSRRAFRESLYEDLEKAEDGPPRAGRTSSFALRRSTPPSPVSFVTSGPYQNEETSAPPWQVSRLDTTARRKAIEKDWVDVPVGSHFINANENSPSHCPKRGLGVTLRDNGPIPLSPNYARQRRSAADDDWIREAGERRQRSNSSRSIYSQKSSADQVYSAGRQRKVPVSANPYYLHRRSPEVVPGVATDDPGPGTWSPRTGFRIIPESPPPLMVHSPQRITSSLSPSPSTPILHASFQTMPSDEFTNTTALHSPSDSNSIQYHHYQNGYTYGRVSGADHLLSSPLLERLPRPGSRQTPRQPSTSFLPSPPQIMSPPLQSELCFIPAPGTPGLDEVVAEAIKVPRDALIGRTNLKSRSKGRFGLGSTMAKEQSRIVSSTISLDTPLPDPRTRVHGRRASNYPSKILGEGVGIRRSLSGRGTPVRTKSPDGVDVIRLDSRRRTLFRKPSLLMGFSYERVSRDE